MKKPATHKSSQPSIQAHCTRKSTSTEAQHLRILEALQRRPHHSYELRKMGIYMVNARIYELRKQGFEISTSRLSLTDAEGFAHKGIALYTLGTNQGASHE